MNENEINKTGQMNKCIGGRKIALLILPLFLILAMPSLAFPLNVTLNVSSGYGGSSSNAKWFDCINSTTDNQIYCYGFWENAGSPFWSHSIYRYNGTLQDPKSCSLNTLAGGYNCAYGSLTMVNQNTALFVCGNAYLFILNVSNISSGGNCAIQQQYSRWHTSAEHYASSPFLTENMGGASYSNGLIYTPKAGIWAYNSTDFYKVSDAFYPSNADWGYGAYYLTEVSMPSLTDNSSLFLHGLGYSGTDGRLPPVWQYSNGVVVGQIQSIQNLYGIGNDSTNGDIFADFITDGGGNIRLYAFDRKGNRNYMANFSTMTNYTSSCGTMEHLYGSWCNDYNLTPMCTDYLFDNCWNPYTEPLPNPFDSSKTDFTVYTQNDTVCTATAMSCPDGYMCIQGGLSNPTQTYGYPIYTTSLGNNWTWGPYVICHSSQSVNNIYYNATGQNDTLINVDPGITASSTCENPTIWNNNSFACILDGCHYCTQESVCKKLTNSCINTCLNDTSIGKCFDSFCNPVTCLQGTGGNSQIGKVITTYFGVLDETTATFYSILISVIVGVIIMILMSQFGVHGAIIGQSFIIIVLLSLVAFTVIGMFPSWLMIVLMVIAGLIVAKSLQVV